MLSQDQSLQYLLPEAPENWKQDGQAQFYNRETLYDYIDGGAELYISYGFDSVISTRFIHPDYGEIRVEIFDMVEAKNAFGVFTHTRTSDQATFGNGSQYFTGAQIFWKGQYFVTVIADDENEEIKYAIKNLSEKIDSRIQTSGQKPPIVNILPTEKLAADGYIYFHHYIWLNAFYFISSENILNISDQTDAVMAKYGEQSHRSYLLIIDYKTPELATEATNLFVDNYFGKKTKDNYISIEDGTWVGYTKSNNFFIAVFNAGSRKDAQKLIEKSLANIQFSNQLK